MKRITCILILMVMAFAPAFTAGANPGGFSVIPGLPENQIPGTAGFFDLIVTPGQQQELIIRIDNESHEEVLILTDLYTVTTNLNGIVDYSAPGRSDETLRYDFSDIASLDFGEIIIPPWESRYLTVSLRTPGESFDGIILGAIRTIREVTQREIDESGMIINRFSHVIPVRLRQTDTPVVTKFLPGLVSTELINGRAAITVDIRNPQPKLIKEVEASAQIYQTGEDTPTFEKTGLIVDFAPNSVFPLTMLDNEGFGVKAGYYAAYINLEHDGKIWEFEQYFEISAQQAVEINNGAVNLIQNHPIDIQIDKIADNSSTWLIIATVAAVIHFAVAIAIFFVYKDSNKRAFDNPRKTIIRATDFEK